MNLTQRFDLAALAKGTTKKDQIELKPIGARLWFEAEIYRIILTVLREYETFKPQIAQAASETRRAYTADAFTITDVVAALRGRFTQVISFTEARVDSLFHGEARRHDEKWIDQVNRVIGVDLKAVVTSAQIEPAIQLATQANVALIKGLTDEVAKRVEVSVIDLVSRGASNKEIAKTLSDIGGFSKARAKLIAVDQASSFNATLNQIRQREAGVTSYIWSTSRDKRVRPAHRAREGQTFRWDSPPSDGHPGRAVRCRCVARPILDLTEAPKRPSSRVRARTEGLRAVSGALGLNP